MNPATVTPFPSPDTKGSGFPPNMGVRDKLATALELLASVVRNPSVSGIDFGALAVLNPSTPASETPQIDDGTRKKITAIVVRGLRRYERVYNRAGIPLSKNPDYTAFRQKIIEAAIPLYKRGLGSFGIVIGDDVLGPGNGISPFNVFAEMKDRMKVRERGLSPIGSTGHTLSAVLQDGDAPVPFSYGFWTSDLAEPDNKLVCVSGERIASRGIITQGCIEHMLFVLEYHLRKKVKLPNAEVSTFCSIPPCRLAGFKDSGYLACFASVNGELVTSFVATTVENTGNKFSHRRMVRVDLPR